MLISPASKDFDFYYADLASYAGRNVTHEQATRFAFSKLKSDVIGSLAARLARVPVIWHMRDRITSDYLPRPVVTLFRRLCRVVPNHIIANSHATLATVFPP